MTRLRAALVRLRKDERGFTLVEMLVATFLFMILGTVLLATVVSSTRGVRSSREYNDLNEEARLMLNRMSRELREAQAITAATNPGGTTYSATTNSSVTFEVDFNGNGVIEASADDPELLTYTYDATIKPVTLQAAGENYPILAANVSFFKITYTSRLWQFDANKDGTVTWQEIDADTSGAYGNRNNTLDQELGSVDSMTIDVTVLTGARRQDYRTQIDLRNRPY